MTVLCVEDGSELCTPDRRPACGGLTCPFKGDVASAVADLYDEEVTDLYDTYSAEVRRFARRGLPPEDAEEVVQDAFLAARVHWARVRTYDRPIAYVYQAVRYMRADRLDAYTRLPQMLSCDSPAVSQLIDERDRCAEVEHRLDVVNCLDVLTPRQAEAVMLRYWSDLRIEQVARKMGISVGNVKRTLSESRERLRRRSSAS